MLFWAFLGFGSVVRRLLYLFSLIWSKKNEFEFFDFSTPNLACKFPISSWEGHLWKIITQKRVVWFSWYLATKATKRRSTSCANRFPENCPKKPEKKCRCPNLPILRSIFGLFRARFLHQILEDSKIFKTIVRSLESVHRLLRNTMLPETELKLIKLDLIEISSWKKFFFFTKIFFRQDESNDIWLVHKSDNFSKS